MKKSNSRVKFTGLALSLAMLLTACSGGSSSSSTAPANTQATLNISNKTDVDFTEISIEDGFTGKVLYSGSFACASQQTGCVLFYTGPEFSGPVVMTFNDRHGHIAAAYDTPLAPGNYLPAEVSLWSTGAYIFDALARRNSNIAKLSQGEIESRLDLFTRNYSNPSAVGHDDNYIDLAMYYVHKIQIGPLSMSDFLDGLAQRLINYEVADASEFSIVINRTASITRGINGALSPILGRLKSLELVSAAYAQSTDCNGSTVAFLTASGSIAGGVANAYPVAGTIASTVSALFMNSCTNIVTELNTIISQLANLQNSLDNLQNRMGMLTNFVATSQMSTNIQGFSDTITNLTQLSKNYQLILTNNKVKSLGDYVKLRGGKGADALAITLQKDGNGSRFEDLLSRIGSTIDQNYLLQLDRLTSQIDTLIGALDLLCKDPGPGSAIVKQRVQCNLVVTTTTGQLIAAQTMAYKLASETYDLLEAYPTEATRFGYDISMTAAQQKTELLKKHQSQLNNLIAKYRNAIQNNDGSSGYYNAFNGLSTTMLSDMTAYNCKYDSGSAAISEWFKTGGDEYIETLCKDNQTPIKARYYLKIGDKAANSNSIANVLGVLVDATSVKGPYPGTGMETATPTSYNNWGLYDKVVLKMSINPVAGTFSVSSNPKLRVGNTLISSGLADETINRGDYYKIGQQPYQSNLFASSGLTLLQSVAGGTGRAFSWLRYTDNAGYSYAFAMNQEIECLTSDCTTTPYYEAVSYPRRIGILNFKNGPQKLGFAMYNEPNPFKEVLPGSSGLATFFLDSKLMY